MIERFLYCPRCLVITPHERTGFYLDKKTNEPCSEEYKCRTYLCGNIQRVPLIEIVEDDILK